MNRRFARWGLSVLSLCLAPPIGAGVACADQIVPFSRGQTDGSPCQIRCTHFEGYVIVPRRAEAGAFIVDRPEAALSPNRLYLPVGEAKAP